MEALISKTYYMHGGRKPEIDTKFLLGKFMKYKFKKDAVER
jgi:hypothetical protein